MSAGRLLRVLLARWRLAAAVMLAVLATVLCVSLMLPKKYTATASVVLDVKSPDPVAGVLLPGMTISSYMGTQIEVLNSERVAARAIKATGLDARPAMREAWLGQTDGIGDYMAWLAAQVQGRVDAKPAKDSNVINVAYTARSPDDAVAVANALVQAYIDTTLELRVEPARQFSSFFDERARQMRQALEGAQQRLSAFQRASGIVNADERLDTETGRLSQLTAQLVSLQAVAEESRTRQGALATHADQMSELLSSPLLITLITDLSRQESRLEELGERLGSDHPSVIQAHASIAQLRARIAAERQRVMGSVSVNSDVDRSRVAQLRQAIQEQQDKLLGLRRHRDEMAVLQRDVENAQKAYDSVYARISQSATESQVTQTNVSVLKRATLPQGPSSPRTLLNMLAAAVLGGLLALAAVIARELADARLRTVEDVTLTLGQVALGVLPAARLNARAPSATGAGAGGRLGWSGSWLQR